MSGFEDGLWRHLVEQHGADRAGSPAAKPKAKILIRVGAFVASIVALVIAAIALVTSATSVTQPAYALTQNSADNSVTVSLYNIATGIPALNAKFAALGIRETVIPVTSGCTAQITGPYFVGATTSHTVTVSNSWIPAHEQGFLAAEQSPNGTVDLVSGSASAPLPSCIPEAAVSLRNGSGSATTPSTTTPSTATSPTMSGT